MAELTPRQTVEELDKYIIGQAGAKRAVAIARETGIAEAYCPKRWQRRSCPKIS